VLCRSRRCSGGQRFMAAGGAKVAIVDGDARNSMRTDGAPLPLREVAPDVSIPRRARNRYVATGRWLRPRPRQRTALLGLSGRTKRSRRARAPGHPRRVSCRSPWRRPALTALPSTTATTLRPSRGRSLPHSPRVLRRPRSLKGNHARYSRNAFRGAHEAIRASLHALRSPKTPFRAEAAFAVRNRTARYGSYLHKRENDDRALAMEAQGRNDGKRRGLSTSAWRHDAPPAAA